MVLWKNAHGGHKFKVWSSTKSAVISNNFLFALIKWVSKMFKCYLKAGVENINEIKLMFKLSKHNFSKHNLYIILVPTGIVCQVLLAGHLYPQDGPHFTIYANSYWLRKRKVFLTETTCSVYQLWIWELDWKSKTKNMKLNYIKYILWKLPQNFLLWFVNILWIQFSDLNSYIHLNICYQKWAFSQWAFISGTNCSGQLMTRVKQP